MSRLWKRVSLAEAKRHPLYGVNNWLAVFAVGVLLGGLRELGSLNGEAHKAGLTITELLAIDHPAISFAKLSLWLNAGIVSVIYWALLSKNSSFRLIASSLLLASWPMGALIGVAYPFDGLGSALALSLFPWAISCGVWVTYLNRSKRVRVTFENDILVESTESLMVPTREALPNSARAEPQSTCVPLGPRAGVFPEPIAVPEASQGATTVAATTAADPDEALWAAALQEVEGSSRRQGLWARAYASSNGNEAAAKAAYLRDRVPQLTQEQQRAIAASQRAIEEAAAEHARELTLLSTAEQAYKLLPKGSCPNCDSVIPLASETCSICKAVFGPGSAWKVVPRSEA